MDTTIERVTAAKHSAGFAVDDLAAACKTAPDCERLSTLLKQAAELFNALSQLDVELRRSAEIPSAQNPSQGDE